MAGTRRNLIAKEIELGFLYIPKEVRKSFPKRNDKVLFLVGGRARSLSYNSKYNRVWGLTEFYRKNGATPNDVVVLTEKEGAWELKYEKVDELSKQRAEMTSQEAEEILDMSEVPSAVKGQIVEQRIAEIILLYGQGLLNVYKPLSDVEGIDLIVGVL